MDIRLFQSFAPVIQSLSAAEINGAPSLNTKLQLAAEGGIEVCYIPFEYINPLARVVIVGITPGRTQFLKAIQEARRQLDKGATALQTLIEAKQTGAFSGSMRPNLVGLLDAVGINRWLGINSCDALFGTSSDLVQSTSALSNPVFINGENYNGTPNMLRHPLLRKQLLEHFGNEAQMLPTAVFVPLGDKVAEALHFVAKEGFLDPSRILDGLPHPSGANAERISYFLGRKDRKDLSVKTNADKLDLAREHMVLKVAALS